MRLVIGFVIGVLVTMVATQYVVPALAGGDGAEDGELVILSGLDQSEGGQRQALVDQWNDIRPANPARIVELPANADQAHSEMVAHAQSGAEQVDIYNLDVTWMAEFADAGFIRPLEDADTTGFLEKPLRTCRYDGKLWGLPFNTDAGLLYYRRDIVDVPPETASEMRETIEEAKPDGMRAGLTTQLADYEGLTVAVHEAVWAAGGEVVGADGRVALDSDEAQAALRRLADDVRDADVNLQASLEFDELASTHAFGAGQALFMRNWPVAYRTLGDSVEFGVTPLPGGSVLGGQNLAVAAKSERPRAAQELIEFLTDPRSQQILFERGGLAATRDIIYLDSAVTSRYPYAKTLETAIQNARLRPVTPHYTAFSECLRGVVRELLVTGSLPPDAVDRLARCLEGR
ncbi:extracellular solute-binding protein [Actinokineospora fastidiosa]|uniref:ABC transporter substrate-binding protein n=1 Tax=Actinokineospora fastidiosa TaxID=1816 RepID=A0A918LG30_9PSEU|nr:extracellular solute-binding protein [Actinokineospora fastidiosa]GGS42446.1 ABC transporter substrate-binding protein [Actinokineospora fastidiosa]